MNDDENSKSSNAFEAIMSTNQKKLQKDKKTITKPKDKKKTKQVCMNDFISANKFYTEEYSNMSLPIQDDKTINFDSNKFSAMDEEEAKQECNVEVVNKQGYSNTKLNPSPNSGLEPNLDINQNTIEYWYYTLGKSFREYQYNIVKTCLSNNTLVALPTGLGKTFVAATVMLNYYLWFPKGKIFFLAPTRPLVNQQIECLKQFELINQNDVFEMTGNYPIPKRKEVYQKKRIFFQTPQTLENDLQEGRYDGQNLSLVIFDEAHRGTGKYAYVNIVTYFETLQCGYRILALSATPGNEFEQIQDVLRNLRIAKLEIKDEEDPDVKQYIHSKQIIPIKIQGNDLMSKITSYLGNLLNMGFTYFKNHQMIPPQLYRIVKKPSDIGRGTSFQILEFIKANQDSIIEQHHTVGLGDAYDWLKTFSQLVHGKKLIMEQGINCFRDWIYQFETELNGKNGKPLRSKAQMLKTVDFIELKKVMKMEAYTPKQKNKGKKKKSITSKKQDLDEIEDEGFEDGNAPLQKKSTKQSSTENTDEIGTNEDLESHPKSEKLVQLLSEYFLEDDSIANKSKTIIFTQSRNSAAELKKLLNNLDINNPDGEKLIRSEIFIGQANLDGQGMNQKLQIETIQLFKKNVYNTLIATCIGEEGLDIGEVDLIICYDSGFSPIRYFLNSLNSLIKLFLSQIKRMIQRMGRTGRKRAGKVYVLLMEGKEFANYNQSQKKHKELIMLLKFNSCHPSLDANQKGRGGRQPKATKKSFEFYGFNPRMIPIDVNPICRIIKSQNNDFTPLENSQSEGEEEEDYFEFKGSKQNQQKQSKDSNKIQERRQFQVEEEEEEEEEQEVEEEFAQFKDPIEDKYNFEIEEVDIEEEQFIMKPQKEKPKKSLEKTQKEQEMQDRLLQLANNINGRKQPVQKQLPIPNQQICQRFLNTPETMTPFSSSDKGIRNSTNNKKQQSVFDANVRRSQSNQSRKSDPKQVTKVPLKSNSKKKKTIMSDSENIEIEDIEQFNRISEINDYSSHNNQNFYSRQLDFNSVSGAISNPFMKNDYSHCIEKEDKDDVVFIKKMNPLHVFGNIEQEKANVMKKRSNSKSSSDFNLNDYSLLYQNDELSNHSELDSLLKQIDRKENSYEHITKNPQKPIPKFNFDDFEDDDDEDDDDLGALNILKNIQQNTNNTNQEYSLSQSKQNKQFVEDNLAFHQPPFYQYNQQQQQQKSIINSSNQNLSIQQQKQQNQIQQIAFDQKQGQNNSAQQTIQQQISNISQQIPHKQQLQLPQQQQQLQNPFNFTNKQNSIQQINQQNQMINQKQQNNPNQINNITGSSFYKMIDENEGEDDDDDDDDLEFLSRIASKNNEKSTNNTQNNINQNQPKTAEKMQIEETKPSNTKFPPFIQKNNELPNPIYHKADQTKQTTISTITSKVDDESSDSDEDDEEEMKKLLSLNFASKPINSNFQTKNTDSVLSVNDTKVQLDSISFSVYNHQQSNTNLSIQKSNNNINNSLFNHNSLIEKIPHNPIKENNFFNQKLNTNQNKIPVPVQNFQQNITNQNDQKPQPLANKIQPAFNSNLPIPTINKQSLNIIKSNSNNVILSGNNPQNKIENQTFQALKNDAKTPATTTTPTVLKNFSGIKDVIEDKNKSVISINNQNVVVGIKESKNPPTQNKEKQINGNNNFKNPSQPIKVPSENPIGQFIIKDISSVFEVKKNDSQPNLAQQQNINQDQPQKKRACDLYLENLKKQMQDDYNPEEHEQRNKNKVVEQPKLDPKKARQKAKKAQEIQKNKTQPKTVQQLAQELREQQEKQQEGSQNSLSINSNQIQKQDIEGNKDKQTEVNQQKAPQSEIPLSAFKDILMALNDSDEDDPKEMEFMKNLSKNSNQGNASQNEQNHGILSRQRRDNPYLDNPDSTYNSIQVDKKQFAKQ